MDRAQDVVAESFAQHAPRLGVDPGKCIALEDAAIGVQAAKSAGAWVIAVPDPADLSNPGFGEADVVLSSLTEFSLDHVR